MRLRRRFIEWALIAPALALMAGAQEPGGELAGIGVILKLSEGGATIERLVPGGAAEKAGLKAGMVITSVDGRDLKGLEMNAVLGLIRGRADTAVKLGVRLQTGEVREFTLNRATIQLPGPADFAGRYQYQDDPTRIVDISLIDGNRYAVSCPAEKWSGFGILGASYYKGVFQMKDDPALAPDVRGAIGFQRIDLLVGGAVRMRSKFNFFESGDRMVDVVLVKIAGTGQAR